MYVVCSMCYIADKFFHEPYLLIAVVFILSLMGNVAYIIQLVSQAVNTDVMFLYKIIIY